MAKDGPKAELTAVLPESLLRRTPTLRGSSQGVLNAGAILMAIFTDRASGRADIGGRQVIDAAGLHGTFDFALDLTSVCMQVPNDLGVEPGNVAIPGAPGTSLFTALQQQPGLKLEPRRAPVEFLVIDRVDQPLPKQNRV